ncbi:sigma-54-dependent sensor transcriptional regulator, PAS and GAF domain-containing [Geotalea daltonii FRC-32]|uniref:Sigma-54-dependent sensor transcriptional regulator, PAS and GAF domain-containing n=1 Tax=Geotalea daltonii (strain DSM 22248 / JCM 15807 / FRC-32) TaxID=316067 RepID=B9M8K6_GEODF|nr:sigma 54-interacting transcriptional regulator [Geotalea daltonii]ACM18541.1 sigma-54-dependent sensor transcriptional regulator, PAS and GAF domain-containing [Geotalea daltonii FRC-32]
MNATFNSAPSKGEDIFNNLEQLFELNQFGIAIIDCGLRYIAINDRMATMTDLPVKDHAGRTLREVDQMIARAVEPVVSRTITEGRAFVDLELVVHKPLPDRSIQEKFWLVCSYPLMSNDGTVYRCGLIVQDITEQKIKESVQAERLQVEAFLSNLSSAFINLSVSEVDRKIEEGLQKLVEFLGFERCSIWHLSPDGNSLHITHSFAMPGIKQPPPTIVGLIPVWISMIHGGETFRVSDIDELPDRFWSEKKYCKDQGGIKSIMFIPASIGGIIVGAITFVSYRVKREWPDELTQRLRLLWEIFANALERKRADQKIQNALAEIKQLKDRLEAENVYLRDQIHVEYKHEEIIGKSDAIRNVLVQIKQVASTGSTVLILGETGTGKELIARAIHNASPRMARAMIKVNCAALPGALIEAELFGHEKGAYTGAVSTQIGRFEAANGSTIFLDEIGELPLELQSKLLRVIQEGQFERLGNPKPIKVDVRVIAATNKSLVQAVKEGTFREDLYYRLNVFPISVPPLRERREDIPLLVWAMVEEFGKVFGKTIERIPKKNMDAMERYHWPGNIRELRNLVERAMILNNGASLVMDIQDGVSAATAQPMTIEGMERMHINSVLEKTGWRIRGRNGAAEILGMKPTTLNSRMKKLGIRRRHLSAETP